MKYLFLIILLCSCSQNTPTPLKPQPASALLSHLQYLSSDELSGRKVNSEGNHLARQYIIRQLSALNIVPLSHDYQQPFELNSLFKQAVGHNIVGIIKGTERPKEYIVLSAHFDHIGGSGRTIYNGADDNASGTAALLYFADKLKKQPLHYSVILLFTDAEEANLKGAKAFIKQNADLLDKIILNINIDMIAGSSRTNKLRYISHDLNKVLSPIILERFKQQQSELNVTIKHGFKQPKNNRQRVRWHLASDHGVFYRQNIPFLYYGVGDHKNYHRETDTYENVNHEFFINSTEAIYQQLLFLDQNL